METQNDGVRVFGQSCDEIRYRLEIGCLLEISDLLASA